MRSKRQSCVALLPHVHCQTKALGVFATCHVVYKEINQKSRQIKQSVNQPIKSINQESTSQSQPITQSIDQAIDQSVNHQSLYSALWRTSFRSVGQRELVRSIAVLGRRPARIRSHSRVSVRLPEQYGLQPDAGGASRRPAAEAVRHRSQPGAEWNGVLWLAASLRWVPEQHPLRTEDEVLAEEQHAENYAHPLQQRWKAARKGILALLRR